MAVSLISQAKLPSPLDGYRLIERLGRGGFGEVWKVEAPGGLLKAAKFVFGDLDAMDEDSRPAEQEQKALERVKGIRHPFILSLEQFLVIDGQLIIVMELADRNLWDRFRECRAQGLQGVPRDELIRYMEETAEALDLMNNYYQIQHLDVKPQNLFLVFNHIKVADFGLAKVLEGVRATVTGGVTPVYAAPETFEGWISRYSDQYSLAIVFQELLTGVRPFNGTNTRQLLMQHINGMPDLNPLPLTDRPIIARGLAKKPDDRWPSCTEMVRALKLGNMPAAPPTPSQTPMGRAVPGSGAPTMPVAAGHALADSISATRMVAMGGSGRLGTDPQSRDRTPPPGGMPPLAKPNSAPSTPVPPLTPPSGSGVRLVTPSAAAANNPAHTLNRPLIVQTGRMGSLGIAPPEKTGDGALFPALIVAVGQTGRRVVEQLKRDITDRFASTDKVPNVRILYVDTDPESLAQNPSPDNPAALSPNEIVPARLNRSTHYMQRDSLPPVEQWLPAGMLYRLPRNPGAANGVRAFGRLALFDHYRTIAQRVRQEIETFLTDDPLMHADRCTGLGLRTNRPRAYVVAGLAGGTGSGMFLDLAFLLRHELRQVGYMRPEVVGVFFVPPADAKAARGTPLGNTYAALAELNHYQARKTRYQTAFDKSEGPITDSDAPFARVEVLQLPKGADAVAARPVLATAARALYHELLTSVGRATDEGRDIYRNAFPTPVPTCQTFGLFRLSWPRPEVLAAATRRLAQRQLQRWTGKDAVHLREHIAEWLGQQWQERKLSFETQTALLHEAARSTLREDPEKVFDAFIDPLRTRTPSGGRLDATSACTVLDQLLKLIGKPECENSADGSLVGVLTTKYEELVRETEGHLSVMAATFIEVPQYRLPGAEEAIRQIGDKLKGQVDARERARADLDKEVRSTYARLIQAIGALGATGLTAMANRAGNAATVFDLLRVYPRKRLQLHVLDFALSIYRRLLGNTPEYLREINFCRSTLADMQAALAKSLPTTRSADGAPGKMILPDGCADLDAAADQFLAALSPEELLAFDQGLQKAITRKFRGLGNICLKPAEKGPLFRELLLGKSREFLDTKLDHSDPATAFLRSRTQAGAAQSLLSEAFGEAVPDLTPPGARPYEMVVVGIPPGPDGGRLQDLIKTALPDAELTAAPLPDDICFYREFPQVPLADLPQLGPHAREAFVGMSGDHPAHARVDVPWSST